MADDLEDVLNQENESELTHKASSGIIGYYIDTSAAWLFWTPMMATMEYAVAGMEPNQVLKSRLLSMGFHALAMRPYCKFREFWAAYWRADSQSSTAKKLMVDCSALMLQQTPAYALILSLSGASLKEVACALPAGLMIGLIAGRPYGKFIDRWRRYWGTQAVLD